MFIFHCHGFHQERATIKIQSLSWTAVGETHFDCNDDALALQLLTQCRSDAAGFFNLLAGAKPIWVEQWLEYLEEQGKIKKLVVEQLDYQPERYPQALALNDEQASHLLDLLYRVGGFNRLQITRYLKNRHNLTYMATKYSQDALQRYQQLGDAINYILKLKRKE